MVVNSRIYECKVYHERIKPKHHKFFYSIYNFCIDLDEIEELSKKLLFFSNEKWNLFSFYKRDHLDFGKPTQKENILFYLNSQNISAKISKIFLVTNLRVMGYVFNPVCFYFCYNPSNEIECVLIEVHNTFGETKPYLILKSEMLNSRTFYKREKKFFYVSPFQDLETEFEFIIREPKEKLQIDINDIQHNEHVLYASIVGNKRKLSKINLLYYFFRFPLVTLHIITQIHLQALLLYLKRIPYFKKNQNLELQKGVYYGKNNL